MIYPYLFFYVVLFYDIASTSVIFSELIILQDGLDRVFYIYICVIYHGNIKIYTNDYFDYYSFYEEVNFFSCS